MVRVSSILIASLMGVSSAKKHTTTTHHVSGAKHAHALRKTSTTAATTEELDIEPMGTGIMGTTIVFNKDEAGSPKLLKGKLDDKCKTALDGVNWQVTLPAGSEKQWYNAFTKSCKGADFEVTVTHHFDTAANVPGCPGIAQSFLLDPTPTFDGIKRIDGKQVTAMVHGVNCVDANGPDGVYMLTDGASNLCSSKLDQPTTSLGRITWSGEAPGIPARITVLANKNWKPQPFVIDATRCVLTAADLELASDEIMRLKGASALFGATAAAAAIAGAALLI